LSAKPVAAARLGLAALCLLGGGPAPVHAKAPLPTVLLYPASPADVPAMVDLRTRLRLDGTLQALTYDPDSASVKRVAAETSHSEWLIGTLSDNARLALARALGVAFYAVVSPGRQSDSTHIELVQTAPPALTFDWYGVNRQYGARAIESQALAALGPVVSLPSSRAPEMNTAPILSMPDPPPVVVAPAPAPVVVAPAPAPVVVAPAPAPVVVAPAPAPVVVAPAPIAPEPVVTLPPPAAPAVNPTPTPEPIPVVKPAAMPEVAPIVAPTPAPLVVPPAPLVVPPAPLVVPPPAALIVKPPTPPAPSVGVQVFQSHKAAPPVVAKAPRPSVPLVAALPPRGSIFTPNPQDETPTPAVRPAPAPDAIPVIKPQPKVEDLAAIAPLMNKGDSALEGGDVVGAIALYRQAVNGAPLSLAPRLKLAQAYQKGGLSEKALSEAQRALEIAPDSQPLQQFLAQLDQENGTSDGTLARYRVQIERNADDPAAHAGLAEALWNSGDLAGAETEYKSAKRLAPAGDHSADAHLAQLYATQARYDDCLAALQGAGRDGYALALKIVKNRADTLSSTLEASRDAFAGGKSTREQFYDGAKTTDAQAQALAGFVARVTPPAEYKLSHLHRMLSTNLLAQEAATLRTFIETGDTKQSDSVSKLEKAAQTEMLTAQAAEEKLGLWDKK